MFKRIYFESSSSDEEPQQMQASRPQMVEPASIFTLVRLLFPSDQQSQVIPAHINLQDVPSSGNIQATCLFTIFFVAYII